MARPSPFDRQSSFAQWSSSYPAKPHSGTDLDAEFNAVKIALDETQSRIELIQDADGRLARGSVGRAQLDSSIALGFEAPASWQPNTFYDGGISTVFRQAKFYIALTDHTSGSSFDLSLWREIADLSIAVALDDGSVTEAKLADLAVGTAKIASLAVTAPKLAAQSVLTSKIAPEAITIDKISTLIGADLAKLVIPAGLGPLPWSGRTAPTGWVLMGGTYSRTTYPALWSHAAAEIASGVNSIYGAGDGSTTFSIVAATGRALVGVDAAGAVVPGLTVPGAVSGAKEVVLATANLPPYTPAGTVASTLSGASAAGTGKLRSVSDATGSVALGTAAAGNIADGWALSVSGNVGSTFTGTAQGGASTPVANVQPSLAVNFIIKAH